MLKGVLAISTQLTKKLGGERMWDKSRVADAGKRNLCQKHRSVFIFLRLLNDSG